MDGKMDIDEALLQVGGMRPYHWLLFTLINLAMTVPLGANAMFYVFIGWTPGHHCKPDNGTYNESYSYQFNASLPQCEMSVDGTNLTKPCEHGWIYDIDYDTESSLVTEWDLVCEYNYQSELAETLSCIGAIIGLIFLAPLADKYGRKPVFLACLLLYIILGTAMAFSPSLVAYNIIRFFLSIMTDVFTCAGLTLMMELYSTKHRSFAGVGFEFYWVFAYFYLAMIMYLVRIWRHFVLVVVVPWVVFMALYWLVPESASWLLSMNRTKEARESLKFLARRNCVKWTPPEELSFTKEIPDEEQIPFMKQMLMLFKDPVLRKHSIMNCLFWFANYNVYLGIILAMPSLAGNKYLSFTLSGVAEIPAYILCLIIVPYGRKWITIIFHILAGVCLFAAALVVGLDLGGEHQRAIMLVVSMIGKFGITASFTVIVLYTIELFPTHLRGAGSSYGRIFGRIGSIGAPFINYWMRYNSWLPLLVMGILATITGIATFVLPETCDKPLPQTTKDVYGLYKKKHIPVNTEDKDGT